VPRPRPIPDKVERLWSFANNYELFQYLGYDKDDGGAKKP
jgi:hypothetical protein